MRVWSDRVSAWLAALVVVAWVPAPTNAQIPRPAPGAGPMEVTQFRLPDYNPDGTLKSEMIGELAVIDGAVITIRNLRVELYEGGQLVTSFWGESCRYDNKTGKLTSDYPVRVIRSGLVIAGEGLDWNKGETVVTVRRNVRVTSVRSMGWLKVEKRP